MMSIWRHADGRIIVNAIGDILEDEGCEGGTSPGELCYPDCCHYPPQDDDDDDDDYDGCQGASFWRGDNFLGGLSNTFCPEVCMFCSFVRGPLLDQNGELFPEPYPEIEVRLELDSYQNPDGSLTFMSWEYCDGGSSTFAAGASSLNTSFKILGNEGGDPIWNPNWAEGMTCDNSPDSPWRRVGSTGRWFAVDADASYWDCYGGGLTNMGARGSTIPGGHGSLMRDIHCPQSAICQ